MKTALFILTYVLLCALLGPMLMSPKPEPLWKKILQVIFSPIITIGFITYGVILLSLYGLVKMIEGRLISKYIKYRKDKRALRRENKERLAKLKNQPYSYVGMSFFLFLQDTITIFPRYNYRVHKIFNCLKFYTPLRLHIARSGHDSLGDSSWFYVGLNNRDVFEYAHCQPSAMAAWQIYLLQCTAESQLPYWWHGGYGQCTYIFDIDDIDRIQPRFADRYVLHKLYESKDALIANHNILPNARMIDDNIVEVICCYWNDWSGLIQETAIVDFKKREIKVENHDVLFEYHCGVVF